MIIEYSELCRDKRYLKYKVLLPPQRFLLTTTVLENVGRTLLFFKTQVFFLKKFTRTIPALNPYKPVSVFLSLDNLNVQRNLVLALSANLAAFPLRLPIHPLLLTLGSCGLKDG